MSALVLILSLLGTATSFAPRMLSPVKAAAGGLSCLSSSTSGTTIGGREFRLLKLDASQAGSGIPPSYPASSTVPASVQVAQNINRLYARVGWTSWWFQIVLSVISGVILTFANTVKSTSNLQTNPWTSGFAFSSIGVLAAFINVFWTWNLTRTNRRIALKKVDPTKILPTLKRMSQISVFISLSGMFITLLGAEQIVGTLASKVLSNQGIGFLPMTTMASTNTLQALDIFLVQANTNTLCAHFAPLLSYLGLLTQLPSPQSAAAQSKPQAPESSSDLI